MRNGARAILEDAPIIMRRVLRWGGFALGLYLGPTRSDRLVLDWELRRSTPYSALLAASSRLGLPAELLGKQSTREWPSTWSQSGRSPAHRGRQLPSHRAAGLR
jgi:hypothetical protein